MLHLIFNVARAQHGVFSLAQALEAGRSSSWLTRQCRRGVIDRRATGVYAVVGAPVTRRQNLMVHVLAAGQGALATADSGLGLWCPELVLPPQPVVAVPEICGYRPTGARLWRSSDLDLALPTRIDGIPVVGVARALLDAAHGRSIDETIQRIDACRRHSPLAVGALVAGLQSHARRGRPGIETYRGAIRRLAGSVPDSDFERFVIDDLVAAGVPAPRLHHVVRLPGEDPIELDLDWDGLFLDVELDGRDHVARSRTARRDRQRDRLLQAVGYRVLRYTWDDYVDDHDAMIAEIDRFVTAAVTGATPLPEPVAR